MPRCACWLLLVFALGACLAPGCKSEPEDDESAAEEAPPDPLAPCREKLAGRWTWGGYTFDILDGGYTIVQRGYDVIFRTTGAVIECTETSATIMAEGRTGSVTFIDADHIEADVPVYGRIQLTRAPDTDTDTDTE